MLGHLCEALRGKYAGDEMSIYPTNFQVNTVENIEMCLVMQELW